MAPMSVRIADKAALRQLMHEQDARTGFVPDPDATPEKVRRLMARDGIRPERNEFSREIVRMRYGDGE